MGGSLTKGLGLSAAAILMFALTFFVLFTRSKKTLVQLLVNAPIQHAMTEKAAVEHQQYVYWGFSTNEISKMIKDLADARESLDARESYIAAEEARIESERKENERLRDEIKRERKDLSDYLVEIQKGETERLKQEVSILNNMTAENIVAVLSEKSDKETVRLLSMMKPDMVALILENIMAQPAQPNAPAPQKHAAELLELLKRVKESK